VASLPYYKFYPADHRSDTVLLSLEADGLYRRLLDAYWLADGNLPNNANHLAKLCGIHLRTFHRIWPEISPFFSINNKRICNPRMDRELVQARERSTNARSAAFAKWKANGDAKALRSNNHSQIHKPSPERNVAVCDDVAVVPAAPISKQNQKPARLNSNTQIKIDELIHKWRRSRPDE
jgi:uncharacterized protein YdaU (DUF1376 family)